MVAETEVGKERNDGTHGNWKIRKFENWRIGKPENY